MLLIIVSLNVSLKKSKSSQMLMLLNKVSSKVSLKNSVSSRSSSSNSMSSVVETYSNVSVDPSNALLDVEWVEVPDSVYVVDFVASDFFTVQLTLPMGEPFGVSTGVLGSDV